MLYDVDGTYHFTPDYSFFVKKKLLSAIPGTFQQKIDADNKVINAIRAGKYSFLKEGTTRHLPKLNVISDDLGTKGVMNPATGKMHDSKSAYYKEVKAAGCEIMGNDSRAMKLNEAKGFDKKYHEGLKKDISQAIDRTGAIR